MRTILLLGLVTRLALADGLPEHAPEPGDNPITAEKVELGKQLFFDRRLSKTGRVSCLTCHDVLGGGEDGHAFSVKADGTLSHHSAPTVWNAAFLSTYFWYGQAASLEEQAEGPLEEMGLGSLDAVVANVAAIPGYRKQFAEAFSDPAPLCLKNITRALASYERTLLTPHSPYDRFLNGESAALSEDARRGMQLFQAIGCAGCHSGVLFAGPALPSGTGWFKKFPVYPDAALQARYHFEDDPGRFAVTGKEEDRHLFRVPGLRGIALTAPYFHNGAVPTLNQAVRVMAKLQLNRTLTDGEAADLEAFLGALTGRFPTQTMPRLPELPGRSLF